MTSGSVCRAQTVADVAARPQVCSLSRGAKAGLLSGGEQQMLAMARALVSDPKVLLVDELSLGLAPIIVEQHVQMALEVADRGCVLSNGTVRLAGSAAAFAANRSPLEATYLGE